MYGVARQHVHDVCNTDTACISVTSCKLPHPHSSKLPNISRRRCPATPKASATHTPRHPIACPTHPPPTHLSIPPVPPVPPTLMSHPHVRRSAWTCLMFYIATYMMFCLYMYDVAHVPPASHQTERMDMLEKVRLELDSRRRQEEELKGAHA